LERAVPLALLVRLLAVTAAIRVSEHFVLGRAAVVVITHIRTHTTGVEVPLV